VPRHQQPGHRRRRSARIASRSSASSSDLSQWAVSLSRVGDRQRPGHVHRVAAGERRQRPAGAGVALRAGRLRDLERVAGSVGLVVPIGQGVLDRLGAVEQAVRIVEALGHHRS
jgi:hypothetical protein